jgi:hypothetical protein
MKLVLLAMPLSACVCFGQDQAGFKPAPSNPQLSNRTPDFSQLRTARSPL